MTRSPLRFAAAATASLALLLAGCGDGDDEAVDDPLTEGSVDDGQGDGDGGDNGADSITVTAVDFGYEDLPATIDAGTAISLVNASDRELHELIALRLPDDEERSVEDLLALPEAELEPLFAGVTDVIVAVPGATDTPGAVMGDGVLDEPGRYAVFCFIPVGADPQAYMDAVQNDEEPEADGAPHFTEGMFAEVTVE